MTTLKQQMIEDAEQILFNTEEFASMGTYTAGATTASIRIIVDENKDRLGDGTSDATISGLVSEIDEPEHNSAIACEGKVWRVVMVVTKDDLVWRAAATRDERFRMK